MGWIVSVLIVVQVICAGAIIILVLLQHGKGADMGAAFGSGASGSLFGASGSANFLSRSTAVVAAIFFAATIAIAYSANAVRGVHGGGHMTSGVPAGDAAPGAATPAQQVPQQPASDGGAAPAAPAAPAPDSSSAGKAAGIPK